MSLRHIILHSHQTFPLWSALSALGFGECTSYLAADSRSFRANLKPSLQDYKTIHHTDAFATSGAVGRQALTSIEQCRSLNMS